MEIEGVLLIVSTSGENAWTVKRLEPFPGTKSNPVGDLHDVSRLGSLLRCDCEGYRWKRDCRHCKAVRQLLEIE